MAEINKDSLRIGVTFTPCDKCDRAEVVLCKDCKHRKTSFCAHPFGGMWVGTELKDTDFCSYGERKDNEN